MSEEKLYAVKDDEGKYWDFFDTSFWLLATSDRPITRDKERAELVADEQVDGIEISKGQSTSFELTDEEAMSLYHFIRQCLLLENKITITVADSEGFLVHRDNKN